VDSGYIFSPSAQSRTKSGEKMCFPSEAYSDHIRPHRNLTGFDRY
jgi:hypothetical protein